MGNVDGAARTTRKKAREQVSTRGDFRSPSASNPCTTWAVGTSIANGDLTFLTLCNFKEVDVAKQHNRHFRVISVATVLEPHRTNHV